MSAPPWVDKMTAAELEWVYDRSVFLQEANGMSHEDAELQAERELLWRREKREQKRTG